MKIKQTDKHKKSEKQSREGKKKRSCSTLSKALARRTVNSIYI